MPSTATTGTHLPSWAYARRRAVVDGAPALHVRPHLYGRAGSRVRRAMVAPSASRHGLDDARSRREFAINADLPPTVESAWDTRRHNVLSECAAAVAAAVGGGVDRVADQSESTANDVAPQKYSLFTPILPVARAAGRTAASGSVALAHVDVVGACVGVAESGLIGYTGGELADRHGVWNLGNTETASLVAALPRKTTDQITAKRHPPSASRVAQCVELFNQLRGDAVYQVYAARIALAHNIGGPTAVSAVTLLEGPGTYGG